MRKNFNFGPDPTIKVFNFRRPGPAGPAGRPNPWTMFNSVLNRHCACTISRDMHHYVKFYVHILISHPQVSYSHYHFHWAPMKNKGAFNPIQYLIQHGLCGLLMLNTKSSGNPKISQTLTFYGARRSAGMKNSDFSTKGTFSRESTSFEHFKWRLVRISPEVAEKNSESHARLP